MELEESLLKNWDLEKKITWIQNLKMISVIGFAVAGVLVYETGKSILAALGMLPFTLCAAFSCLLYVSIKKEDRKKVFAGAGESITMNFHPYYMGILIASTNIFFWWSAFNH